jgi:hypothetical protein
VRHLSCPIGHRAARRLATRCKKTAPDAEMRCAAHGDMWYQCYNPAVATLADALK